MSKGVEASAPAFGAILAPFMCFVRKLFQEFSEINPPSPKEPFFFKGFSLPPLGEVDFEEEDLRRDLLSWWALGWGSLVSWWGGWWLSRRGLWFGLQAERSESYERLTLRN